MGILTGYDTVCQVDGQMVYQSSDEIGTANIFSNITNSVVLQELQIEMAERELYMLEIYDQVNWGCPV